MFEYTKLLMFGVVLSIAVALPTNQGLFEDVPQPVKVSSFDQEADETYYSEEANNKTSSYASVLTGGSGVNQVDAQLAPSPVPNHQHNPVRFVPNGLRTQSSGPWHSLTAEPMPQPNLPKPVGSPTSYQGVKGSHRCFPGDGCYYGFWKLYGANWLPPKFNGSYVAPVV